MNYDTWLTTNPNDRPFAPGEEDLLKERIFIPEYDAFGTVEYGEADEDDYGYGITMSIKVDGVKREIGLPKVEVEELLEEQAKTPIHEYDPQRSCGHTFKPPYGSCPHCGISGYVRKASS